MPNPTRDNASRTRAGAGVAGNASVTNRRRDHIADVPLVLVQTDDVTLPPWRMARHAAALIEATLIVIYSGRPISITGRKVLADTADRLRQLSQVLQ